MTQTVTTPDGVDHEFPDNTSDEAIKKALKAYTAEQSTQADATAQSNAAAGVTNEETGQSGSGFVSGAKEALRSGVEGLANIVDTPWTIGNALQNSGAESQFSTGDEPAPLIAPPSTGHLRDQASPVADVYNSALPPDPEHPWVRNVARVVGPALVEAATGGGASGAVLPSFLRVPTRAAITTGGTLVGGEVGKNVDIALGGDGRRGESLGSIFFGGVAPSVIKQGGWKAGSHFLTDEDSPALLSGVDRLNRLLPPDKQIPVSAGLVGSDYAKRLEDFTASVAGGGGPAFKAREGQYAGFDAAGQKIAENMRDEPSSGVGKAKIGQNVRTTAETADEAARARQNTVMNEAYNPADRNAPISQVNEGARMDEIEKGVQPQYREPVSREKANVQLSQNDPLNAPKIVDSGLEAQLEMRLNQAKRKLDGANNAENAKAAQTEIDSVLAEQAANRGQTFQEVNESRSRLGQRIEGQIPFDQKTSKAIKDAKTGSMKDAARLAGTSDEAFDAANAEYSRLYDQRDIFDRLRNAKGQGEAYNAVFSGTGSENLDQLQALHEHAADPLRQALADQFERKMRGKGAGLPPSSKRIGKVMTSGPDWWADLPPESRNLTAGHESSIGPVQSLQNYDDASALSDLMYSDTTRPNRTTPGSTSINNNANAYRQIAGVLGAGGGFALGGLPGAAAGFVAPAALAHGAGWALTSDKVVRRLVGARKEGILDNVSLARILASATGNPGSYDLEEEGAH